MRQWSYAGSEQLRVEPFTASQHVALPRSDFSDLLPPECQGSVLVMESNRNKNQS